MPCPAILVFAGCILFVLYVLFGYPLLLRAAARRAGRTVRKEFSPRTVSVLLAVRNGESGIGWKLDSLFALDYPPGLVEIFVLSDGSTDGTCAVAAARQEAAEQAGMRLHVVELPAVGKSDALNAGLARATGEIVFFTDLRQPLDRNCLRELVACFGDPSVGVASGELIISSGETAEKEQTSLYWRYEKQLRIWQSAVDSVIGATGAVYAQRRELCRPLPPYTLLDDVHQPLAAFFAGYRVILDPAAKAYDNPTALNQEFRRKVRTLAGNYQVFACYPALFGPRNRMLWHFLSHKFARLLLPWALLAALGASFFLPNPWNLVFAGGQVLFYSLALVDSRLTAPVRTFVVLMAATLWAGSIAFRPARSFW